MILDEQIDELLGDLASVRLEGFEGLDESVCVPRNIRLVGEEEYSFREVRVGVGVDAQPYVCVDGGNAPVMSYGGFLVEFNKVVGVEALGGGSTRRLGPHKFLSLTYVVQAPGGGRSVNTKIYYKGEDLWFAPRELEPKFLGADSEANLSGRARRVVEHVFAAHIVSHTKPWMVVLDGSLGHTNDRAEIDALDRLLEEAGGNGVVVAALAKSSSIMFGGEPLTQRVERLALKRGLRHFYVHIGRARRGSGGGFETQLYVVKLNSVARKAYLLEVYYPDGGGDVSRVVSALAANSNNVALPGYPQALVLADRYSHVYLHEEVGVVKMAFRKRFDNPIVREAFAHELLDQWG